MSMHQGIDLSRFKKVSSDKKTTTLRHSKGHEIKIAHNALTPAMKEHLNSLEMAEGGEVKHFYEGGPSFPEEPAETTDAAPTEAVAPLDPQSPAPVADAAPPSPMVASAAPVPADQPQVAAAPVAQPQAAAAPAVSSPQTQPAAVPSGPPPRKPAAQVAHEMMADNLLFAQDLKNGHLKPETIQSLYNNEDTLGKIGTLFGLLVSGAGAGLSHQPNAVLEMMNNQIKNDFESKKSAATNAQNWLQLSQAHELQKAQIEEMGYRNELAHAQAGRVPYENTESEARAASSRADASLKWQQGALIKSQLGALDHIQKQVIDKQPEGPLKTLSQNTLDGATNLVLQHGAQGTWDVANQIDARQRLRGDVAPQQEAVPPAVDLEKLSLLQQQGQIAEHLGMPGGMRAADIAAARQEGTSISENRAIAKTFHDSFQRLSEAKLAGKLNPNFVAAETATLNAEIARETAGKYITAEAAAQAKGTLPDFLDWGQARPEKYRKMMMHFANNEAGTQVLDQFGLKTPFPFSGDPNDGKIAVNKKTGERMIMRGGKLVPLGAAKRASK